jgi:hypothetical protein
MGANYAEEVYYDMEEGTAGSIFRNTWDIAFRSNYLYPASGKIVPSSSIISNTTIGIELYTYPNGDISDWYTTTAVNEFKTGDFLLDLYPVPASDLLHINYELDTQLPVRIQVYDLTGKLVLERTLEPAVNRNGQINISALQPGIYTMQVGNREARAVRKFTVR